MKMKKLVYFIPLLIIGCKEAPKDYYSVGEVKVIEPVKSTTIISDSNTTSINTNKVSPEAIEYMNKIKAETPLNHMINPEETAPHVIKIRVIK